MATPVMPDPPVPLSAFDPRYSPDASREECMVDIDFGADNLLEEKQADPESPGTRGDETGIAAEIIRRDRQREGQGY